MGSPSLLPPNTLNLRRIWREFSEEAEKVISYLVAKNILSFLCAHENYTFDNLFLLVLTTIFALLPRALGISHLNKTFHCCTNLPYRSCVCWCSSLIGQKRKPIVGFFLQSTSKGVLLFNAQKGEEPRMWSDSDVIFASPKCGKWMDTFFCHCKRENTSSNCTQHQFAEIKVWIVKVLYASYRIPFLHPPSLIQIPLWSFLYRSCFLKALVLSQEVMKILKKSALEVDEDVTQGF